MKIIDARCEKSADVGELNIGDLFVYGGYVCMKVNEIEGNVFNLTLVELQRMPDTQNVILVDGELVISNKR